MKKNYTVYESLRGKKHYLVFFGPVSDWPYEVLRKEGTRYFRCGEKNLEIEKGWIYMGELYLDDPGSSCATVVTVVSHWRRK